MYARGITEIVYTDSSYLGDSVAAVNVRSGVCYLNVPLIKKLGLSKDAIYFIIKHEEAHLITGSSDEATVDKYAHEQYMREGKSLKQSVYALTRILNFNRDEHYIRANLQLQRALAWDRK